MDNLGLIWEIMGPGIAGAVFGAGWWFWVDAVVCSAVKVSFLHYLPGIFASLAALMFNCVDRSDIGYDYYSPYGESEWRVKLWLFVAYVVSFVSLAGSVGMLVQDALTDTSPSVWTGVAGVLQCVFVLIRVSFTYFEYPIETYTAPEVSSMIGFQVLTRQNNGLGEKMHTQICSPHLAGLARLLHRTPPPHSPHQLARLLLSTVGGDCNLPEPPATASGPSILWFPVHAIRLDDPYSGIIHFDVGVVNKHYLLSLFEIPPDCSPVFTFLNAHLEGSRIDALVAKVPFMTHRFILVRPTISSNFFHALFPLTSIVNSANFSTNSISYMPKTSSSNANAAHDGRMESPLQIGYPSSPTLKGSVEASKKTKGKNVIDEIDDMHMEDKARLSQLAFEDDFHYI
ncbi:transmembrane protein 50A [Canna indica]|uniref:Transmembrane protein 50A n=1 Tax=Canna indica TaxID=4628 RepID=A0AAQ3L821_9LILI|nr:transmembrane protein 50A [Canna indica]